MIISLDAEKGFDKIWNHLKIKSSGDTKDTNDMPKRQFTTSP